MEAAQIEQWIADQLTLTVGEGEGVSRLVLVFRLEHSDGTAWGTWPRETPELAKRVSDTIATLAAELPTGRHTLKLIAIGKNNEAIAAVPHTVQGMSSAAKVAQSDQLTAAKATAMNVATAEQQLAAMSVRCEKAERLAADWQEKYTDAVLATFQMADHMQGLLMTVQQQTQKHELDLERTQLLRETLTSAKPIFDVAAQFLGEELRETLAERNRKREQRRKADETTNPPNKEKTP